jgi:hypothetical protein
MSQIRTEEFSYEESRLSISQEPNVDGKQDGYSQNSDELLSDEPNDDPSLNPDMSDENGCFKVRACEGIDKLILKDRKAHQSQSFPGNYGPTVERKIQYYQPSPDLISFLSPLDPTSVTYPPIDSCKCTRSRCLMLYCDCFQAGQVCSPLCVCVSCKNTRVQSKPDGSRFQAIEAILLRRPDAFSYKPRKTDDGCRCKKNRLVNVSSHYQFNKFVHY